MLWDNDSPLLDGSVSSLNTKSEVWWEAKFSLLKRPLCSWHHCLTSSLSQSFLEKPSRVDHKLNLGQTARLRDTKTVPMKSKWHLWKGLTCITSQQSFQLIWTLKEVKLYEAVWRIMRGLPVLSHFQTLLAKRQSIVLSLKWPEKCSVTYFNLNSKRCSRLMKTSWCVSRFSDSSRFRAGIKWWQPWLWGRKSVGRSM